MREYSRLGRWKYSTHVLSGHQIYQQGSYSFYSPVTEVNRLKDDWSTLYYQSVGDNCIPSGWLFTVTVTDDDDDDDGCIMEVDATNSQTGIILVKV